MTWLAVPLYAHAEGLSNAQIGALFAAPVLAQVPLNLAGGAYWADGLSCRPGHKAGRAKACRRAQPAGRLLAPAPSTNHPIFDALRLPLGAAVFAFHLVLPPAARRLRLRRGGVRHPARAARSRRDSRRADRRALRTHGTGDPVAGAVRSRGGGCRRPGADARPCRAHRTLGPVRP